MKVKQISVYREMTMRGKIEFTSQKIGGSVTMDVEDGEDVREVYHRAWLIVGSQILKEMNQRLPTQETKEEQLKIDTELGW